MTDFVKIEEIMIFGVIFLQTVAGGGGGGGGGGGFVCLI